MSLRNHSGGSRRWNYFHSALELAIQRSAHKWQFEDFAECFPQYVEKDKDGAFQTFTQVADYIESADKRDLDDLFGAYDLQNKIDILDNIVSEAKARKASGEVVPNVWTEDLHPRSAIRGRTIPILDAQAKRLRDSVAKLEAENTALISELESKIRDADDIKARTARALSNLRETQQIWTNIPMNELQGWTAEAAETASPTLRS
ncbi:hypothetical protein B0H15DRAFT_822938 [Mycena belliarum]|uniref:Uncharacterized protein n=1 Tax=Mycena belliarum TaxID=1033014 RepID=A0AAD6UDP2_9AGAR|nr:hypothetical protein B0H15DRAFT_822938 [Mycena belliae]